MALYYNKKFPDSTEDIPSSASFGILLDKTPFYAESGGQEHDTGSIVIDGHAEFEVADVQGFNGYILHIGEMKYGSLSVGDEVVSTYDEVCFNVTCIPSCAELMRIAVTSMAITQ